jgi:hypothetical protein
VQQVDIQRLLRYCIAVATTNPKVRKEDERLKKALENADLKKFDKMIKSAFGPGKKAKKKPSVR